MILKPTFDVEVATACVIFKPVMVVVPVFEMAKLAFVDVAVDVGEDVAR